MELCFVGLKNMGLTAEAQKRRTAWQDIVGQNPPTPDFAAVPLVVQHLATHPMANLGGKTLGNLAIFDEARLATAVRIKGDLARNRRPEIMASNPNLSAGSTAREEGIPQLLATAARLLYEDNPAAFSDEAASLDVIELIASINAGLRRGARRSVTQPVVPREAFQEAISSAAAILLKKPAVAPAAPPPSPATPVEATLPDQTRASVSPRRRGRR
jgi:hypothetical protein